MQTPLMVGCLSAVLLCGCAGSDKPVAAPADGAAADASAETPETECIAKANPEASVPQDAPTRISVKHLVVKHIDVAAVPDTIDRTRGAACLRALEALDALKAGTSLEEVVASYSDEAGAATRGGSIGQIKADDVEPAFAAAAFALDIGQVSYVVETKFGFHVIMRTE